MTTITSHIGPMRPAVACGFASILCLLTMSTRAQSTDFTLPSAEVGTTIELSGRWNFKPGASDSDQEAKQVPVPQMLSRIQWWLDDSEDFKKFEQARLDKLGIDTEKTDDGTYTVTFDAPKLPKDRRVWVEFDGVAMKCKTSINGEELGEHKGMFNRFGYDLTPHLKPGKNTLTVWASMEKIPQTDAKLGEAVTVNLSAAKVISMSKGMFGPLATNQDNRAYDLLGIWQPVRLVVRGEAKIDDVWWQPATDGGKLDVTVRNTGRMGKLGIGARWTNVKTKKVLGERLRSMENIPDDEPRTLHVNLEDVVPELWTPADPNLYRLDVFLRDGEGTLLDFFSQQVGFRAFEIKKNQFLLNGNPYWLRGANQLPYGKNPWDLELPRKLIQMLHDANQRFTRTHATPWNETWLRAADEIGLAVSIEGIRPWAFAGKAEEGEESLMPPPEIFQHWLMENEDVVRRCRNHPSVFIFTVGNEMLLRDTKNVEKWKLLSEVTKQTRKLAPDHPIVCSSDYTRDPEFYAKTLKPAGIDDGDVDDMHRYYNWYNDSNFVLDSKFERELKANKRMRPLMGQEFASGYPDLDTGLPVLRYTRDLLTPQAWIGNYAYPGNDAAIFLDHHAKITKHWAEKLRYQRENKTAGFSIFSAECWFSHSYDPAAVKPYPVLEAMKQAFAPIGVAVETNQRRFYAGDEIETNVYVTNDDERFQNLSDIVVHVGDGKDVSGENVTIERLKYYETTKVPIRFKLVDTIEGQRKGAQLVVRLTSDGKPIGETRDAIEIFAKPEASAPGSDLPENVIIVKKGDSLDDLAEGKPLHDKIAAGATAIAFAPANKQIAKLFLKDFYDDEAEREKEKKAAATRAATRRSATTKKSASTRQAASTSAPAEEKKQEFVEFADFAPCAGTKLAENLQPMDLKWWARKNDNRTFMGNSSERLRPGGEARELIRFIPPHGYIAPEKVPEQYRTVLCEIPVGKGRLWICNLDIESSAGVDPAARIFADNLYRAAVDPDSTRDLPKVPTHEQLLKGEKTNHE